MYENPVLTATARFNPPAPNWEPLEAFLPLPLCHRFMFMDVVDLEDDRRLYAYKHGDTRTYLYLDDDADSWERLDQGRFRRMRHSEAMEFVFDATWILNRATGEEQRLLKAALDAAWARGNGDESAESHIPPCCPASPFRELP